MKIFVFNGKTKIAHLGFEIPKFDEFHDLKVFIGERLSTNAEIKESYQIVYENIILNDCNKLMKYINMSDYEQIRIGYLEDILDKEDIIVELFVCEPIQSLVHLIVKKRDKICALKRELSKFKLSIDSILNLKGQLIKMDQLICDIDGEYIKLIIKNDSTFKECLNIHDQYLIEYYLRNNDLTYLWYRDEFNLSQTNSLRQILYQMKLSLLSIDKIDSILNKYLSKMPSAFINSRFLYYEIMTNRICEYCFDYYWKSVIEKFGCDEIVINVFCQYFRDALRGEIIENSKSARCRLNNTDKSTKTIAIDALDYCLNYLIYPMKDWRYLMGLFIGEFSIGFVNDLYIDEIIHKWKKSHSSITFNWRSEMNSNKKYECVTSAFQGIEELIKSKGTYLFPDILKIHIENLSKQFELKKDVQITFCVICDKLDNKSTLIDALLKEKVSDHLKSDHQYLVKSDPFIQETIIGDENQKLCTITVAKDKLKLLDNSNIVLSFENYSQLIENIQRTNAYIPDVVVLVVNSPKDLQRGYIQSFFNSIKGQFNYENFIFVLNEGEKSDCSATNVCDVCYPSNIRHLFSSHKLENRGFKISASQCLKFTQINKNDSNVLHENFEDLLEVLEKELDIDHVMDRFKEHADNIKNIIEAILQNINVKNLEKSINEYDNKLNEKAPIIIGEIENHQSNSINDVNKMFKNNRKNNVDKKIQLKTFLDENCNELNRNIQQNIIKLAEEITLKDSNKIIEAMSKNILYDHGFKQENIKKKAYELFYEYIENKNLQNVAEENVDEQNINERFIDSAIEILKGIFGNAKEKFISFMSSFKVNANSIVNESKTKIYQAKFNNEFKQFKMKLEDKMNKNWDDLFSSLRQLIKKYSNINLHNQNNLNSEFIAIINKKTDKMIKLEEEIEEFFASSGKFSNENYVDYIRNYFPKTDFENFRQSIKTKLYKFSTEIQDDRFFEMRIISGGLIGGASGAATGALIAAPLPILTPVGALVGGILGSAIGLLIPITHKFLKSATVLIHLGSLNDGLYTERKKMIKNLFNSMDRFVANY